VKYQILFLLHRKQFRKEVLQKCRALSGRELHNFWKVLQDSQVQDTLGSIGFCSTIQTKVAPLGLLPDTFYFFAQNNTTHMEKNRLEAFSDGVLAIIITIMVLEIKVPRSAEWHDLLDLWPVFFSYLLSFIYIGIYWGNHHHLLYTVKRVNAGIIWSNLTLLFTLSLLPFATGWMGENHFETNTVATYGAVLELNGLSFYFLQACIQKSQQHDAKLKLAIRQSKVKGVVSQICYLISIPLAFWVPAVSFFLFFAVAVVWIVPERGIVKSVIAGTGE